MSNEENMECEYEKKFLKERRLFFFFTFLSILIPILSFIDALRPINEEFSSWFQRSGSTMVVFSLIAETRAYQMFDIFKPSGIVSNTFAVTKAKYSTQIKPFNAIAFILITIGTVIWGYGDLLV